jgi:hypothetical protein
MSKYVAISDEKEFIRLDTEIKDRAKELEKLKTTFRKKFDKGYKFKLLTPKPSDDRYAPDWKEVAYALAKKYVSSVKHWEKQVAKEYPPTPVATSFIVPKEG